MLDENRVSPWSVWFTWYMAHTASNDKKSSSAFLWVNSNLHPKPLNFLDIYILVNENALGYVIRKGSPSLLCARSGLNLFSILEQIFSFSKLERRRHSGKKTERYCRTDMWLLDWSLLTIQKGRKVSECEMTHVRISNRSGLTALKSKLQTILPYVQILPSVCKHLMMTSVGATYWEAEFISPEFITRRGSCRSRKKDCLLHESPHTNSCNI